MRELHEWEVRGQIDTDEVLKTIFHPNLYLYLKKEGIKDIADLRITLEVLPKRSLIHFYEE